MTVRSISCAIRSAALLLAIATLLSGCSTPLFAGLTLGEIGLFGSLFSTAATGKGLGEHAMDVATGDDCRVLEGLARDDRKICERDDSPPTANDWKGLASLAGDPVPPDAGAPRWEPRDGGDG
jgi:hypothetical protein